MIFSSSLIWQCASIQSPSGGGKDVTPPIIISTHPIQFSTGVNTKYIKITFDEFFKLRNIKNELLISPPLEYEPKISISGKSLLIELDEKLKENRTYTFNFGKGIADFHEGNILNNFTLVFGTGEKLDSLSIQGEVFSTPEKFNTKGFIVGLYSKDSLYKDSTIYKLKPNYSTLVDEEGRYQLKFVQKGSYELIAFEDINGNKIFDGGNEKIAFHNQIIEMLENKYQDLWIYQEKVELKILESKDKGRIHWTYNQKIDEVNLYSKPEINFYSKIKEDSLLVWPIMMSFDSVYFFTEFENKIDSILTTKNSKMKFNIDILPLKNKYLKDDVNLVIEFTSPIIKVDTSKIKLLSDSSNISFNLSHDDFYAYFDFDKEINKSYQIFLNKGAITGLNENTNKSLELSFFTKEESALSALKVNLNTTFEDYFLELIKEDQVIETIYSSDQLIFKKLLPSDYKLRIILDKNKDKKWTAGDYFNNKMPEKAHFFTELLKLRANWELEIDWKLE